MAKKKKKIEFFQLSLVKMSGKKSSVAFQDLLTSPEVVNRPISFKGKDLELKIFISNSHYVLGMLETSRSSNLPPKKDTVAKKMSKLGLKNEEGLAYGNVFLYDIKRQIFMYESNKFGSYLDHFVTYIYSALKESQSKYYKAFRIKLDVVLTSNEYQRILNFDFHKSVEVQIAQPSKMMKDISHKNGALYNVCKSGKELESGRVFAKFEVEAKRTAKSLSSKTIREVLQDVSSLLKKRSGENVQKVTVTGYENDLKKLKKLDLIANRYYQEMTLDEPRENHDLLEKQRTDEMKRIYKDCQNDLKEIFG
ncbi:hypothetical protein JRG66_05575 [Salinimicrobium tongyeongense]|uniref:Initiator Replication protein n=1 Tax=Salinimicrobium tongyeongense TaxID=2809707 RepID=A0ABY6NU70_9FLAO|nr:DUF6731 family protein [Salinimicrobium tongyeongense]UZH56334.1 hypothetical protein JRG66_05575 [Salinimicrobium tongyeongense]